MSLQEIAWRVWLGVFLGVPALHYWKIFAYRLLDWLADQDPPF